MFFGRDVLFKRSFPGAVRAADAAPQIIGLLVAAELLLDRWGLREPLQSLLEVRALDLISI